MTVIGLPEQLASTLVAILVVSFALTSLDSATRLLRYNISEMGETVGVTVLNNRYVASGIAIAAIWFFAFFEVGEEYAGLVLWQLFGTTNHLLAALALLAITAYLLRRGKPLVYTLLPMAFMLVSTLTAMSSNLADFWRDGQLLLFVTGGTVLVLAAWLTIEASIAVRRYRRYGVTEGLDVEFETATMGRRIVGGMNVNPWLAVAITGVLAFGLHLVFVLAFRNKH